MRVADHTHPSWWAQGLGVYRFWCDLGDAAGAVVAELVARAFGLSVPVVAGGGLTFVSGPLAARWITDRYPGTIGAGTSEAGFPESGGNSWTSARCRRRPWPPRP